MKRKTEQRKDIRKILTDSSRPLTAQEIFAKARELQPRIGVATIYRAVNALVEEKWLHAVDLPGEASRYERAGIGHHHHFQCECCRRVFDVPGCGGVDASRLPAGFEVVRHEILLYGRCADCIAECAEDGEESAEDHACCTVVPPT
jgi:Fur family ferric uptake transcriptional regulator